MEEEAQLVDPARGVHVLVGHHAGDRGLVNADVVGHVAQDQGPQVRDPVVQEAALVADDRLRDLVDGALPLVHALQQPQRAA